MPPGTHRCTLFHLLTCHSCAALLFYSQPGQWGHKPPPAVSAASVLLMVPLSCSHACLCVCTAWTPSCLHNFPAFWITGCKRSKGRLRTMTDGGGKQQGINKDKRQRGERGTEAGWLQNSWLHPPYWVLLVPKSHNPAPPLNSTASRAPGSTKGHRGPGRSRSAGLLHCTPLVTNRAVCSMQGAPLRLP